MPTYRYRCLECKKTFERIESMTEHRSARPRCPECKSSKVVYVFAVPFVKTSKKS